MADDNWYQSRASEEPRMEGIETRSFYLPMRDGVKIAVDLWLPRDRGGAKLPAILHMTRYMRSVQLRRPLRWLFLDRPFDHTTLYMMRRRRMLRHGYAWLDVDVRGSGASSGQWIAPWGPWEVQDGKEIVDWIVAQEWSNGRVGSTGISYDGSCAEMLLVNRHPAVKAAMPRFASFEPFLDIAYPGGVFHERFVRAWHTAGDALDRNAPEELAGPLVKLAITGVSPVDGDTDHSQRAAAIAEHGDNCDVYGMVSKLAFRDTVLSDHPFYTDPQWKDRLPGHPIRTEGTHAIVSGHNYIDDMKASGTPIYAYSGWFDCGYPHAAIKRYMSVDHPDNRLILGPWNHGGGYNCNPALGPTKTHFDHGAEQLRFFDHHLKGIDTGIASDAPVHYYTMVEEKWKGAETWPPPGTEQRAFYFGDQGALSDEPPECAGCKDEHVPDYGVGTGPTSRWQRLVEPNKKVIYPDRREQDARMLCYTTGPLSEPLEVTGHGIAHLHVTSSAEDGHFHVYLEDVHPDGRSTYVTEGMFRALHRKPGEGEPPYPHAVPFHSFREADALPLIVGEVALLSFDLLPVSYLFESNHRIRIALAGADRDAFAFNPPTPPTWEIHRNASHPSHVLLPVMPR